LKPRKKATPSGPFAGFPRGGVRLLHELGARQDRAWYQEHKDQLDAQLLQPMRALMTDARPSLEKLFPKRVLTPKVFRLHRDVRFSNDKSPFKDHASGVVMLDGERPGSTAAALYLQVGPDEGAAAGIWSMEPEQLAVYRRAVLDERPGAELTKLLRPLVAKGYAVISSGQLKRAPRGIDPAHPRLALLRHKGLALDFPPIPVAVRHSPALLRWCLDRTRESAKVLRWLLVHAR